METKKFIPNNCSDALLVKGFCDDKSEYRPALLMRLKGYYEEEYKDLFQLRKDTSDKLFHEVADTLLNDIVEQRITVNDRGRLVDAKGVPLKKGELRFCFIMTFDALLVKGCYNKDPKISEALYMRIKRYYDKNYYGLFKVKPKDAEEIFQMAIKAILVNITMRRIYVNDDGILIGTQNEPFTSVITSYFMSVAKNMYFEWMRIRVKGGLSLTIDVADSSISRWSGYSFPFEREGEDEEWYWYVNGESTGIKVMKGEAGSKLAKQMPYIGDDLHWWVGNGPNAKDLGALYNDFYYDDKQITQLTKIARRITQMNCLCKHILTFSLYLEKTNDEIAKIKGYAEAHTVAVKKHECLEKLYNYISGVSC